MESLLNAITPNLKSGNEPLILDGKDVGHSLLDFWKWSASDLLSNAIRGIFAEFLVGSAMGLDIKNVRNEWAPYDLVSNEGIKIEVKSSAYIQSWLQKKYSTISYSIKPARFWDAATNIYSNIPERSADVYVFCLLKHLNQETIDPLNLSQWEFYVLPTVRLDGYKRSQSSITLNSLQKLCEGVMFDRLKLEILKCYTEQKQNNIES